MFAWALTVLYLSELHFIAATWDQLTHIISGRLVIESLTPGFSQVGFWAPLLHIIIVPFMSLQPLASTGIGASIALLPFISISVVLVYELCIRLACSKNVATFAALLFLFNPYVLFFSAVPMAEILLITHVLACAYFFDKWMCTRSLQSLIYAGVAVSLASLSRFEGFLLIPITLCLALFQLWRWKVSFYEAKAIFVLFFIPTVFGLCFIMVYSYVYSEQVLAYSGYSLATGISLNNGWGYGLPFRKTAVTIFYAMRYMIPVIFIVFSIPAFIATSFVRREYLRYFSIGSILISPIIFVYVAILLGKLRLVTPETSNVAYYLYENIRYTLTCIGFPIIASGLVIQLLSSFRWKLLRVGIMSIIMCGLAFVEVRHTYHHYFKNPFEPLMSELAIKNGIIDDMAKQFNELYDYGRILTLRYGNDLFLTQSGLSLSSFVLEYNYRYFEQTAREPWVFVRWVVVPKSQSTNQNIVLLRKLETNGTFLRYFDLVLSNPTASVYRLRDSLLREQIATLGYDPIAFPSLGYDVKKWDPASVYQGIQGVFDDL